MSKERFLTVLVPITDEDCEATVYSSVSALVSAVPPSADNINKIYKIEGGAYERVWENPSNGQYEYHEVVDREFPSLGEPIEIFDFTYEATRMGSAPTISAQGIMRFAGKDEHGGDVTLDGMWSQQCHVSFNGENFYLKQIPTSSKSNDDARYKYDMDFVAERVVLERVYIYDVVSPFITERPISESSTFSFYGDIEALANRINASLIRSGLATLTRKYVQYSAYPKVVPYLTYEQWTQFNIDPTALYYQGVFEGEDEMMAFHTIYEEECHGGYNIYLMSYIYESTNGVYDISGYQCKIGTDKFGNVSTSDEKLISFDNNTIHEALQEFHDTFGLEYYIVREKDQSGHFTGNTHIMVADCEHDFADVSGSDFVRDSEGIPTTENPFDYGVEDELLSKEKTNTTEKIVTRITGVGSTENIPWYYPNPNPDGWIRPVYKSKGIEQTGVTIDYPSSGGSTPSEYARYEKYLKNRIGKPIKRGMVVDVAFADDYESIDTSEVDGNTYIYTKYRISTIGMNTGAYPNMTLKMDYTPSMSGCNRLQSTLTRGNYVVGSYDSYETYAEPSFFQEMFLNRDGMSVQPLGGEIVYRVNISYQIPNSMMPYSERFDHEGYHYPAVSVPIGETQLNAYVGENFYQEPDLQPFVRWQILGGTIPHIYDAGYSTDGTPSGKVSPIPRVEGNTYKDVQTNTIYRCKTSEVNDFTNGQPSDVFESNPKMSGEEWVASFVNIVFNLYKNDGWYLDNKKILLSDYGISLEGVTYPTVFDTIEFQRLKWLTPQQNLMPEVYIKTDGAERFYNAHNYYPLKEGTAYTPIGEEQVGTAVRNPIYKENETDADNEHYVFENEYVQSFPQEHIEKLEDIKPTIFEQTNIVDGNVIRIDVVEEFAYDATDNDEIWESNDNGDIKDEYKHPYFFAKLRPLGFNLFDFALQEDMVISMTTGNCGACNFKIGVDEKTKKNPVQLWEYDVYRGDNLATAEKLYNAGELRRYVNIIGLYYDTDGTQDGYVPVGTFSGIISGGWNSNTSYFERYDYSGEMVSNGYVGTMKKDGRNHFEGDVVTSGRFIDAQQDTSENYVWVALLKDVDTYGTIMPSARPNYNDQNLNVYIEPKGIHYTNRSNGEVSTLTEDVADKFVITNIALPQIYLRRAERKLSKELVKYMYDNNYQKFNFSIKFSRIFLEQNQEIDEKLNENSVLYVLYNGGVYRQYVKGYTYRMTHDAPLPEVSVNMNEELSVSRTMRQQEALSRRKNNESILYRVGGLTQKMQDKIENRTMGKGDSVFMSGNIIIQGKSTSLVELANGFDSMSIPSGGAVGQVLTKASNQDNDLIWSDSDNSLEWQEF